MRSIPAASVDLILCDLPYGTTACKWDAVIPFPELWAQYKRIIKRNGAVVLTASQPFTSALVMSNPEWFRVEWIWEKNRGSNFATTKWYPMKEHESVLVFGKGPGTYNPIYQERTGRGELLVRQGVKSARTAAQSGVYGNGGINSGYDNSKLDPTMRVPRSIQRFNTEVGLHPTQKPVALMEYLIKTYTNEGEIVLDNCMGSGTTGVACANTGRSFIGIERDEKYFAIAEQRISAAH